MGGYRCGKLRHTTEWIVLKAVVIGWVATRFSLAFQATFGLRTIQRWVIQRSKPTVKNPPSKAVNTIQSTSCRHQGARGPLSRPPGSAIHIRVA